METSSANVHIAVPSLIPTTTIKASTSSDNIEVLVFESSTSSSKASSSKDISSSACSLVDDETIEEFQKTLNFLKTKIGLPEAHSTPNGMDDCGIVQSHKTGKLEPNMISASKQKSDVTISTPSLPQVDFTINKIEPRIVELTISTPINVNCKGFDNKCFAAVKTKVCHAETDTDFVTQMPLIAPKSEDSTLSFEYFSTEESSPNLADSLKTEQFDRHLENLCKIIKTKKIKSDVKKYYMKKLFKEIFKKDSSDNAGNTFDSKQDQENGKAYKKKVLKNQKHLKETDTCSKSATISGKYFEVTSNFGVTLPVATMQISRNNKTSKSESTRSSSTKDSGTKSKCYSKETSRSQSSDDYLLTFAENERRYQLNWINSELNHLNKLKKNLEMKHKKSSKTTKKTDIYNVSEKDRYSERTYLIKTNVNVSTEQKMNKYIFDSKEYVMSHSWKSSDNSDQAVVVDNVYCYDSFCKKCNQFICSCPSKTTLQSNVPSLCTEPKLCSICQQFVCICHKNKPIIIEMDSNKRSSRLDVSCQHSNSLSEERKARALEAATQITSTRISSTERISIVPKRPISFEKDSSKSASSLDISYQNRPLKFEEHLITKRKPLTDAPSIDGVTSLNSLKESQSLKKSLLQIAAEEEAHKELLRESSAAELSLKDKSTDNILSSLSRIEQNKLSTLAKISQFDDDEVLKSNKGKSAKDQEKMFHKQTGIETLNKFTQTQKINIVSEATQTDKKSEFSIGLNTKSKDNASAQANDLLPQVDKFSIAKMSEELQKASSTTTEVLRPKTDNASAQTGNNNVFKATQTDRKSEFLIGLNTKSKDNASVQANDPLPQVDEVSSIVLAKMSDELKKASSATTEVLRPKTDSASAQTGNDVLKATQTERKSEFSIGLNTKSKDHVSVQANDPLPQVDKASSIVLAKMSKELKKASSATTEVLRPKTDNASAQTGNNDVFKATQTDRKSEFSIGLNTKSKDNVSVQANDPLPQVDKASSIVLAKMSKELKKASSTTTEVLRPKTDNASAQNGNNVFKATQTDRKSEFSIGLNTKSKDNVSVQANDPLPQVDKASSIVLAEMSKELKKASSATTEVLKPKTDNASAQTRNNVVFKATQTDQKSECSIGLNTKSKDNASVQANDPLPQVDEVSNTVSAKMSEEFKNAHTFNTKQTFINKKPSQTILAEVPVKSTSSYRDIGVQISPSLLTMTRLNKDVQIKPHKKLDKAVDAKDEPTNDMTKESCPICQKCQKRPKTNKIVAVSSAGTTSPLSNSTNNTCSGVTCYCCKLKAFLAEIDYLQSGDKLLPICSRCFYNSRPYCGDNYIRMCQCWSYCQNPSRIRYSQCRRIDICNCTRKIEGLAYTLALSNDDSLVG